MDIVLKFGGGHPSEDASSATANRVALKACVQARKGRDLPSVGSKLSEQLINVVRTSRA